MTAFPIVFSAPGAAISVCFAPEEDCAGFAAQAIDRARRQILVSAYNLTTGAGIVEALVRARARGVDVRLIADKRTPCERNTGIDALAAAGTPIWIDRAVPIAHAKTMVIDGAADPDGVVQLDAQCGAQFRGFEPRRLARAGGGLCRAMAQPPRGLGAVCRPRGLVPAAPRPQFAGRRRLNP